MYTVFLAGGIGSGKSTAARELERLGACRIDLDQLSREVLQPGSPIIAPIQEAFGADLVDAQTGGLNRGLLAQRAFATKESIARLETIELPAIAALLEERLAAAEACVPQPSLCVVEVPLLDRMESMRELADEVIVIDVPLAVRRERAIGRGMTGEDFDARAANQPSDDWLREHATTVIANDGTAEQLRLRIGAWYEQRTKEEQ